MSSSSTNNNEADKKPKRKRTAQEQVKAAVDVGLSKYMGSLSKQDKIMVMQGWNKVLAFRTAFSEGLVTYWRLIVAAHESDKDENESSPMHLVENNRDPIAIALQDRIHYVEELVMGMLDGVIRSYSPDEQIVHREAYRATSDEIFLNKRCSTDRLFVSLEPETTADYFKVFARCGILPDYWVLFVEAYLWALRTHTPYAQEDDVEDWELGVESAHAKLIAQGVAKPAIESYGELKSIASQELYAVKLIRFWDRIGENARLALGERFYRLLLTKYPELMDYFSKTDMDSLAGHMMLTLDMLVRSVQELGVADGGLRTAMNSLGIVHRQVGIATFNYPVVGSTLLEVLDPSFQEEERLTKTTTSNPTKASELHTAFLTLYVEVMSLVYYPMLHQEKLIATAKSFYEQLQKEFNWSDGQLNKRIHEIEDEIASKGTYTQTAKELEMGARLAWRNSAKCIGRTAWHTLRVRDCRHLTKGGPSQIFKDVCDHLKIATGGTNIQSVMSVYPQKSPKEKFGIRFWSSQFVRYAAYEQEGGEILGDPANLELTNYLLEHNYWTPPEPRTAFDVLPLVLKYPGREKPYIYQLPADVVFEVAIEHPTNPKITALGYKWTTVPAISNFKMTLGGVTYQNIPFNGWFVSTEIVRNLLERYNAGPAIARVLGYDPDRDPVWRQVASAELDRAILHSFQKHKFTIVDSHSAGESFCAHVRREREQFGRECPGQWSWIGGFTGHTNPTWHLEMRDFWLLPQYEYAAEDMLLHTAILGDDDRRPTATQDAVVVGEEETLSASENDSMFSENKAELPKVLIVYGSEMGTAESVARQARKLLASLRPLVRTLNDVASLDICLKKKTTHLVCICSTFGEGGPPSNAKTFFKTPFTAALPDTIKYSVLALGSTLYPDFCKAGADLDRALSAAGLERLADMVKVDEVSGSAAAIEGWLSTVRRAILPPYLEEELNQALGDLMDSPIVHTINWKPEEAVVPPPSGRSMCLSNAPLTDYIHKITFQAPSPYETGDHLSVQPLNQTKMVKRFLHCFDGELVSYAQRMQPFADLTATLGSTSPEKLTEMAINYQASQPFQLETFEMEELSVSEVFFPMPTTLQTVLECHVDFAVQGKPALELLELCKKRLEELLESLEESQAGILEHALIKDFRSIVNVVLKDPQGKMDEYYTCRFPNIIIFLEHFKTLFLDRFVELELNRQGAEPLISLADVLMLLPRLQPRFYSISSSSTSNPDEISLTVGLFKTQTSKGVPIEGVASHYLSGLVPNRDTALVQVRKSNFRLPEKIQSPLIMVGAGTGLSPLMGFMEDRALQKSQGQPCGEIQLFFGCRTEAHFIYEDLIKRYESDGLLNLHLALSRSTVVPKKYVQDKITDLGKAACDLLLDKDTHYYVCGDARMANACHESCVQLLHKHGLMSRVAAAHYLKKMRIAGRWQTDVWGIVSHFEDAKKALEKGRKTAAKIWLKQFNKGDDDDDDEEEESEEKKEEPTVAAAPTPPPPTIVTKVVEVPPKDGIVVTPAQAAAVLGGVALASMTIARATTSSS